MKEKLKQVLSERRKWSFGGKGFTKAAVLVPIFCKEGEYHLLFTKRSDRLPSHKGQVSFPGGAYSEVDSSLLETALRESWEEIGVRAEDVEILGELDDTPTTTSSFNISPFVGLIPYPYQFVINRDEIDAIFDVPISVLLNKDNWKEERHIFNGEAVVDYSCEYQGWVIWGATARIVRQFLEVWKTASGAQS
ncbi:MAG TPA: CoA pyrophosphatase [Dehalococcoidia bacterium]|nr:CoA pyrophosphatase [Dehalococcoidia bacterium]